MAESWPEVVRSASLQEKIAAAKVLAVGAGGIGCELLKTLVLSGFRDIEVVDMDTIETSNLNRQFLFRRRHVGESKAKVAAEAVMKINPKAKVVAHQDNIKQPRFNVDYFKQFALVLNGLDNLDARRHVNRMCIAAGTPLVESGTAGYLGQVTVHIKGVSECFECTPKPTPKSYPICTIRNTPDKPIHCIVWAKELLFQRLFGKQEAATDLDEGGEGDEGPAEDVSVYGRQPDESSSAYAARIFDRVFGTDIDTLISMQDLWKTREKPKALYLKDVLPDWSGKGDQDVGNKENRAANGIESVAGSACKSLGLTDTQKVWDVKENARVFLEAVRIYLDSRPQEVGNATFDKDDDLAVEFVTSAANLRALCYGIGTQNIFVTKGMAGNIIHAIATTNAIVSGLIVIEAIKLVAGMSDKCKDTFLLQESSAGKLIAPGSLMTPNPHCLACGTGQAYVSINTHTTTLKTFIEKLLKGHMGAMCPSIMIGDFMYEEGEDLEPDEVEFNSKNLSKMLKDLPGGGIVHGSIVDVQDQLQQHHFKVVVSHQEDIDVDDHPHGFIVSGSVPQPKQQQDTAADEPGPSGAHDDDDDDMIIVEGGAAVGNDADDDDDVVLLLDDSNTDDAKHNGKRPVQLSSPNSAGRAQKRQKTAAVDDDDIVVLD